MICPPHFPTGPFMHTTFQLSCECLKASLILHTIMHGAQVDGIGGFSTGQPIEHPGVVLFLTAYTGGILYLL
jgi:hypothetical protein